MGRLPFLVFRSGNLFCAMVFFRSGASSKASRSEAKTDVPADLAALVADYQVGGSPGNDDVDPEVRAALEALEGTQPLSTELEDPDDKGAAAETSGPDAEALIEQLKEKIKATKRKAIALQVEKKKVKDIEDAVKAKKAEALAAKNAGDIEAAKACVVEYKALSYASNMYYDVTLTGEDAQKNAHAMPPTIGTLKLRFRLRTAIGSTPDEDEAERSSDGDALNVNHRSSSSFGRGSSAASVARAERANERERAKIEREAAREARKGARGW